jgi:hypothetical protein
MGSGLYGGLHIRDGMGVMRWIERGGQSAQTGCWLRGLVGILAGGWGVGGAMLSLKSFNTTICSMRVLY